MQRHLLAVVNFFSDWKIVTNRSLPTFITFYDENRFHSMPKNITLSIGSVHHLVERVQSRLKSRNLALGFQKIIKIVTILSNAQRHFPSNITDVTNNARNQHIIVKRTWRIIKHYIKSFVGLGGLGVTCSPQDQRFADSNPAEEMDFFTSHSGGALSRGTPSLR